MTSFTFVLGVGYKTSRPANPTSFFAVLLIIVPCTLSSISDVTFVFIFDGPSVVYL